MIFFFSSRRRHTRLTCDWSSDVCSSDLLVLDREYMTVKDQVGSSTSNVWNVVRAQGGVQSAHASGALVYRSEERRVGKESRSRWSQHHYKKNVIAAKKSYHSSKSTGSSG